MGVMLQAFYWDCPRDREKRIQMVETRHEANSRRWRRSGSHRCGCRRSIRRPTWAGLRWAMTPTITTTWASSTRRATFPTWFGTKKELLSLIETAHRHGLGVIADVVINHNSGADESEVNPLTGQERWTLFKPQSGKFPRNWECFHPSMYESWDEGTFGDMPDLSHRNPYVYAEILKLARWLVEEIGFDGFRYDLRQGLRRQHHHRHPGIPLHARWETVQPLRRGRVLG